MGAPQRQTSIVPSTFTDRRFSMTMLMGAGTAENKHPAPLPAAVARARQRILQEAVTHPHASPEKPVLDHRKWHGAAQQYLVSLACSLSLICTACCMQPQALVSAPACRVIEGAAQARSHKGAAELLLGSRTPPLPMPTANGSAYILHLAAC